MDRIERKREEFGTAGVEKFRVDADSATVTVKMWEEPQICVEAELEQGTEYESAVFGDTFQVFCRRKMKGSSFWTRSTGGGTRLTIFLPREKRYQEAEFSIGAGKLYMKRQRLIVTRLASRRARVMWKRAWCLRRSAWMWKSARAM